MIPKTPSLEPASAAAEVAAEGPRPAEERRPRALTPSEVARGKDALLTGCRSLLLATADAAGHPDASTAPFVRLGTDFYVHLSALARHHRNLGERPEASVLLVEDESAARSPFARRRLSARVSVERLDRGDSRREEVFRALEAAHGPIVRTLRSFEDFDLHRLSPVEGLLVLGFGQAYRLAGPDLKVMAHRNEEGHAVAPAASKEAAPAGPHNLAG